MLQKGLKELKKVETWGVVAIIVIVLGIFLRFLPQVNASNLTTINPGSIFIPIGVTLFAMLGFTSIPELREEIRGQEKNFKKAIIFGSLIPVILYILFSIIFIGILGNSVPEVATLSFGPIMTILGIFTMFTSFFVLTFALKDSLKYDMKASNKKAFFFASVVPLILYLLAEIFSITSFALILGIGGTISGGLTGILILLMAKKAKEKTQKVKPKINMKINWPIIIILSIIFITAIIMEFLH